MKQNMTKYTPLSVQGYKHVCKRFSRRRRSCPVKRPARVAQRLWAGLDRAALTTGIFWKEVSTRGIYLLLVYCMPLVCIWISLMISRRYFVYAT